MLASGDRDAMRAQFTHVLGGYREFRDFDRRELTFVEPLRIVQNLNRLGDLDNGDPLVIMECIPQSFPVEGHTTPMSPDQNVTYVVPDIYGRPWAKIWERYHEKGMERPKEKVGRFGL